MLFHLVVLKLKHWTATLFLKCKLLCCCECDPCFFFLSSSLSRTRSEGNRQPVATGNHSLYKRISPSFCCGSQSYWRQCSYSKSNIVQLLFYFYAIATQIKKDFSMWHLNKAALWHLSYPAGKPLLEEEEQDREKGGEGEKGKRAFPLWVICILFKK